MFEPFVTATIQKITLFIGEHDDFFQKNPKQRAELIEKGLKIPEAFQDYLTELNEKDFFKDLNLIVQYASGTKDLNFRKNRFFHALTSFLTGDFARKMDLLDNEFYLYSTKDRETIVEKLIAGTSQLAEALRNILLNQTYQQITSANYKLVSAVEESPYILIQSPREIEPKLKKEIRAKIREEKSNHFPIFQINKKLIGGIRVFKDGETTDNSWLSRVLHFTSLTSA